jgi:hypothetical protein
MMADNIIGHAMGTVVLLDGLVMLGMGLLVLVSLLLVVVHHRQALPSGRAIETIVVPLLMVLAVHALQMSAGRIRGRRFGWGRWLGREMAQERIEENAVGDRAARAVLRVYRVSDRLLQIPVTICHMDVSCAALSLRER